MRGSKDRPDRPDKPAPPDRPSKNDAQAARLARMARVRVRMDELGVDALVLSHGADLPWLTGYRAMPLERLTALVLPRDGEPVLFVPALEAPRVPSGTGLFTLRPWAETEDPVALTAAAIGASAVTGSGRAVTLAVSDRAWAHTILALQASMPSARWLTASTVTSPLRAVKDGEEIEALQRAAQAADRVAAVLQAGEIPVTGRREIQVSEAIGAGLLAAGHRRVNFAIVGSGPNAASPHHEAGDRVIGEGDTVVCDFGGEYALHDDVAYCSDITRTVAVGEPGSEIRDCYAVLLGAQQAAVAAVRPGVTAEHIDAVARSFIAEAGLGEYFIHRTGHGIGIEEHEDPYLVAGNDTPLQVGHAFSVEPGIYVPGRFGMRLEDIVVVGEEGPIPLNTVDHSMVVLG